MGVIEFNELALGMLLVVFAIAAGIVWFAGTKLSQYGDLIAKKTGTGDVIIGTLLLGGVTSLPEIVTTISASAMGHPQIALNNLFGGVALQATILVVGDALIKKQAISSLIDSAVVKAQGFVVIILLAGAAGAMVINEPKFLHLGVGSILIFIFFVSGFYLVNYLQAIHWWQTDPDIRDDIDSVKDYVDKKYNEERRKEAKLKTDHGQVTERPEEKESFADIAKSKIGLYVLLCSIGILLAGYTLVNTGEAIAEKTGISTSLIGAILVAIATSLPELSTTISAVGLGEYRLAFSNIFGTNIFTVGFVFLADVCYLEGPILDEGDAFAIFGALLGIVLTAIYLLGLSIRLKKTVLGLGIDSLLVLLFYLAGVAVLFNLSGVS